MRYLKNKVSRALKTTQNQTKEEDDEPKDSQEQKIIVKVESFSTPTILTQTKPNNKEKQAFPNKTNVQKEPPKGSRGSTKNIVKNYGRAFASFALSNLSLRYLEELLKDKNITLTEFREFVISRKEGIDGISSLREMLLVNHIDGEKTALCKKIFQEISIIFIKFFSVNWVFDSKVGNKIAHLKSRFKMLRRIRDPEHFTYLKSLD